MKQIWAPWRIQYINMKKPAGCILCTKSQEGNDAVNLVLHRGERNFVMLNIYPYTSGHLMVAPFRHIARMEELTPEERQEHIELVSHWVKRVRDIYRPDGFNVGINMGKVAGAGIDEHIHTHIVPRWQGDTNFMPVLADVKVINEALTETYRRLKESS